MGFGIPEKLPVLSFCSSGLRSEFSRNFYRGQLLAIPNIFTSINFSVKDTREDMPVIERAGYRHPLELTATVKGNPGLNTLESALLHGA